MKNISSLDSGDFRCCFTMRAPIEKAYEAITTHYGLSRWWTERCDVDENEGGRATFYFGQRTYTQMRIDRLERPCRVEWHCVAHAHHDEERPLKKTDEWVGNDLVFTFNANRDLTILEFRQYGLHAGRECYTICRDRWHYFLGKSLRSYLEKGIGFPERNINADEM